MGPRQPAATHRLSMLFFTSLFSAAFARYCFFDTLLFARLQVKGVAHPLNDVFPLHRALETTQRVFEGFALVKPDFRQLTTPPNSSRWTR